MEGIRGVVEANGHCTDDDDEDDIKINLCHQAKAREWYHADEELHATEADLEELEEEQRRENDLIRSDSESKPIPQICSMCGDEFETEDQYNEHFAVCNFSSDKYDSNESKGCPAGMEGKDEEKFSCSECDRRFKHRNSLLYHMLLHTGERPHQCEVCGKSFFAASALKVHMRMHSGSKPFQCSFANCKKFFRQSGDLKYHVASLHSDEKEFQCEFCGKEFARKYSLILHRRIHTGEKNYRCDFCPKTFRASSYLQNHRRIHTGEKPHPCEICGKPFRVRGDMKRHMNLHNRYKSGHPENHSTKKHSTMTSQNSKSNSSEIENDSEFSELETPKLECMTPNYSQDQDGSIMSHVQNSEIRLSDRASHSEVDENMSSPESEPIDLNITAVSKAHNIDEDCESEQLMRYRNGTTAVDKDNAVYIWPVYMS